MTPTPTDTRDDVRALRLALTEARSAAQAYLDLLISTGMPLPTRLPPWIAR